MRSYIPAVAIFYNASLVIQVADAFQGPDLGPGHTVTITDKKMVADAVEKMQNILFFAKDDLTFATPGLNSKLTPLEQTLNMKVPIPVSRHATQRKRWGIDNNPSEYWFNNKIHTFGNTGLFGGLHAAMAPVATKMIDTFAYDGHDIRESISKQLRDLVQKPGALVLDMCCGVGMSTRALQKAFHDAEAVIGVDTSPQMISMARAITRHESESTKTATMLQTIVHTFFVTSIVRTKMYVQDMMDRANCIIAYVRGNAQRTKFPNKSFDLVTVMYAFHEAPRHGRYLMLREARRLLQDDGKLAIIDICPTYTPSPGMLAGEPYVLEYQQNIQNQINKMAGFADVSFKSIVPGHVVMWTLQRKTKD